MTVRQGRSASRCGEQGEPYCKIKGGVKCGAEGMAKAPKRQRGVVDYCRLDPN